MAVGLRGVALLAICSWVSHPSAAAAQETSHLSLPDGVRLRLGSYLDIGFFDAQGDGVAYVRDAGKQRHPRADTPWVFDGDPWANPINSQGDSADLGLDRTNIQRYDPVGSGGAPSFIVNVFNLTSAASLGESLFLEASINFEPRQGHLGSSGDTLDVDLAYLEWTPFADADVHLFAGKFESTFGIEYRRRKAPDRFGITPSIISRYTTGTQTGLKVRAGVWEEAVVANIAITNGSTFTERFAHFFNEVDANSGKTVSGRLSAQLPLPVFVEIGASGQIGSEDGQRRDDLQLHQMGLDLQARLGDLELRGEVVDVGVEGGGAEEAAALSAEGWYVEGAYQLLTWAGAVVRVDRRIAKLRADTNLYFTNLIRGTVGLRFDVSFNAVIKLEYVHIETVVGPELEDDVATSSLIIRY